MALTVARLIHAAPWECTAHRDALRDLVEQRRHSPDDDRARCATLGLPTKDATFVALLVDLHGEAENTEPETLPSRELGTAGVPALVGDLAPGHIGILLAPRPAQPWRPIAERLSRTALGFAPHPVVSVGSEVTDLSDSSRSFREAARAAEATSPGQPLPRTAPSTSCTTSVCAVCCTPCARTPGSRTTRNGSSAA